MVCLVGFGLALFILPSSIFLALSMLTRFGQGIGVAIEHTTYPLILSAQYPEEQALATGIYQAFKIVGVCSGPFLGGILYSALGYSGIFLLVALLCSFKLMILSFY